MAVLEAIGNLRRMISKGPEIATGTKQAHVIAVAAQKGGVGKTTTSVHVAAGLARYHNRKVLLLDMDAQGHVGASLSRILPEIAQHNNASFGELLLQKRRDVYELAQETGQKGLFVVPSDRKLNETELMMAGKIGKELLLRQALRVARTHFDVILIDCPPNLGSLTINALTAADYVLVPSDMSVLSLDGVDALLDTIETIRETLNPTLRILGLVRTRVDRRNLTMNRAIEDTLQKWYSAWTLETTIGISTAIAKSQLNGQPIFLEDEKNKASKGYKSLAKELDQKLFS